MRAHEQVLVQADGAQVRFAHSAAEQAAAVALLDRAEAVCGAPLVDEQERARLDRLAHHDGDVGQHWHLLLSWADDQSDPTGYAGLQVRPGGHAHGDLVLGVAGTAAVVPLLLDAARMVASDHGADKVVMWARHLDDAVIEAATSAGWAVHRRLLVLGRDLDPPRDEDTPGATLPPGIGLTTHRPEMDPAIAELLARAYAGTHDGGWDLARLRHKLALPWFRSEDLLVALDGDRIVGIHWTKRRDGRTGEVYNLAVDPDERGRGLGAALLDAGLSHLAAAGADRVVLWVDAANATGLAMYEGRDFQRQWQDVALTAAS